MNVWIHLLNWTLRPIDIESLAGGQLNAIESIFLHFYTKFTATFYNLSRHSETLLNVGN